MKTPKRKRRSKLAFIKHLLIIDYSKQGQNYSVEDITPQGTIYKVAGQSIYRQQGSTGSLEKIYTFQDNIFMPKVMQIDHNKVFVVGGSGDVKNTTPLSTSFVIDFSETPFKLEEKAKMTNPR